MLLASCSHTTPVSITNRGLSPGAVTDSRSKARPSGHVSAGEPRVDRLTGTGPAGEAATREPRDGRTLTETVGSGRSGRCVPHPLQ